MEAFNLKEELVKHHPSSTAPEGLQPKGRWQQEYLIYVLYRDVYISTSRNVALIYMLLFDAKM